MNTAMETKVKEVEVKLIRTSPYQPRTHFDQVKLEELVASVKEDGVVQPLIVRRVKTEGVKPGTEVEVIELVAGERRLRASKMAGLKKVPAIERELTDRQAAKLCLLENIQRENLTLLEEARSFALLKDKLGMKQKEIAAELGLDENYVSRRLRILSLPDDALAAVDKGTLSLQTAEKLAAVDESARERALGDLKRGGMDSGELTQRHALGILDRMYLEPQKVAKKWEEAREEVMDLLPECEWVVYEEAARLWSWNSGHEAVNEKPLVHLLRADMSREEAPTWGELAAKHGLRSKLATEYLEDIDSYDEEERAELDGFLVGSFQVMPVVETTLLIDAEKAAAQAEGKPCIFRAGGNQGAAALSDEEKQKQAEERAAAKLAEETRERQMRELAGEVMGGNVSLKKETDLAVEHFRSGNYEIEEVRDWLAELDREATEEEIEKANRKIIAMIRKPGGGFALIGKLYLIHRMVVFCDRDLLLQLLDLGLLKKYPELEADAMEWREQQSAPDDDPDAEGEGEA